MIKTLEGQVAIVTGAARGIGRGLAARLAHEGCRVVVWDRDVSGSAAADAGFEPGAIEVIDVSSMPSVARAIAITMERVGRLDVLVNNAGINGTVAPVPDYPLEAWDRVIDINLTSVFYCCRVAVPRMVEATYGRIVSVASIAGKEGVPGIAAYAAAKAGVIGFTKSRARELVDSGVLVNCIAPVITETDLFNEMMAEHIASAKARVPTGQFLTIEEIAAMVAWIASPECSFTTGFTFDLSGGCGTH